MSLRHVYFISFKASSSKTVEGEILEKTSFLRKQSVQSPGWISSRRKPLDSTCQTVTVHKTLRVWEISFVFLSLSKPNNPGGRGVLWLVPQVLLAVTELSKSPAEVDWTSMPWDRLNHLLEEPALEGSQATSSDQFLSFQIAEVRGGESHPLYLSTPKTGNGYKQNMLQEGRVWVKSWRGRHNTWALFLALPQPPFSMLCSAGAWALCKWNKENCLVCLDYKDFSVTICTTTCKRWVLLPKKNPNLS